MNSHDFAETAPPAAKVRSDDYELRIRQGPERARVAGVKEKDRKPVDPPPIIQLTIKDDSDPSQNYLQSPYYFMCCNLYEARAEGPPVATQNALAGTLVSSLHRLKDVDNSDGGFFVFGDLSVKIEGEFRLLFSLFEMLKAEVIHIKSVMSDPFTVYAPKHFPGMSESTFISRSFGDQGVRLRIRKEPRTLLRKRPLGPPARPEPMRPESYPRPYPPISSDARPPLYAPPPPQGHGHGQPACPQPEFAPGQPLAGHPLYARAEYARGDYSRADYARDDYPRADHSRGDYPREEYPRADYGRDEYSRGAYARRDYSPADYSPYAEASKRQRTSADLTGRYPGVEREGRPEPAGDAAATAPSYAHYAAPPHASSQPAPAPYPPQAPLPGPSAMPEFTFRAPAPGSSPSPYPSPGSQRGPISPLTASPGYPGQARYYTTTAPPPPPPSLAAAPPHPPSSLPNLPDIATLQRMQHLHYTQPASGHSVATTTSSRFPLPPTLLARRSTLGPEPYPALQPPTATHAAAAGGGGSSHGSILHMALPMPPLSRASLALSSSSSSMQLPPLQALAAPQLPVEAPAPAPEPPAARPMPMPMPTTGTMSACFPLSAEPRHAPAPAHITTSSTFDPIPRPQSQTSRAA
ncbi:MAG: hypothetical protein M1826_005635 [Phylliscum demangeonii]|nr:MAG: hypothetical protein M1826_005635 [Phylliscum demangeonii]